ncbi:beta-galactosidase [Altererythrobacter lutimaris]|uniref:Beta-galactosidase n=1 Tax=Altererythrobacter lutimaris TaxID=2743979 RepID=A0A850HG05_9SPHN|nr:beta-galactosidase [Altererythrobacter lutimaris]NVE93502.1 beta-galactosidase [Altererythrobacter lutimaris]
MELGVCYYPEHWPQERWAVDAQMMRDAGLSQVRIGEFAWSRIEPESGKVAWDWLDQAVETLHAAGLKVIMGTPTATPPKWLVDHMPDMVALDRNGKARGFGSRRHYCFSHKGYKAEAARITRAVAERYGDHPAITAWQTDNEYGCHDTVQSFSPAARDAFRKWLEARYKTVEALNAAWGNVFWSMEYRSFEEIELPNLTVTEANPAHWLAFRRFSSDQVMAFNRAQVDILRELSPGRAITHNAMGFYTGYDHFDLGEDLDVLGWDSYPLGFLEMFRFSDEEKTSFARCSHPDIAAFHHDLYRGCAKDGRWSVLEQQPGPVNWARHNPAPLAGMVKLWTLEAAAHGAELVSYFRWRQFTHAQEQMHAGLLRPDGEPAPALGEARQAADMLEELGDIGAPVKHVAIVFDYAAEWMTQIQPQGEGLSALWAAFDCYSAMRRLGLNVDFVKPGVSLTGYALVILPCNPIVTLELAEALEHSQAQIIIGPRTGSRDADFAFPPELAPGALTELCGLTVALSESLRPGLENEGDGWAIARWLDHAEAGHAAEAELVAKDGTLASFRHGRVRTLATWPQGAVLETLVARAARDAGLPYEQLNGHKRRRTTSRYVFDFDCPATQFTVSPV